MSNVYYKVLNKNISSNYTEKIIAGLQRELSDSTKSLNEDLFDVTRSISTRRTNLDMDSLLKYYVINQLLKNIPEQAQDKHIIKTKYVKTANDKYRKDPTEDKYYRLSGEEWVPANDISEVNEDGSYVVSEKKNNSYIYRKVYDVNDNLISVQVLYYDGKVVKSMSQVVELMNMKKEFAKKFKYSGYSGDSHDIIAAILNKFSSPKETGYYMDQHYYLYSWDARKKCFMRNFDDYNNSPLLRDYEFNNHSVIRKEYTGVR